MWSEPSGDMGKKVANTQHTRDIKITKRGRRELKSSHHCDNGDADSKLEIHTYILVLPRSTPSSFNVSS